MHTMKPPPYLSKATYVRNIIAMCPPSTDGLLAAVSFLKSHSVNWMEWKEELVEHFGKRHIGRIRIRPWLSPDIHTGLYGDDARDLELTFGFWTHIHLDEEFWEMAPDKRLLETHGKSLSEDPLVSMFADYNAIGRSHLRFSAPFVFNPKSSSRAALMLALKDVAEVDIEEESNLMVQSLCLEISNLEELEAAGEFLKQRESTFPVILDLKTPRAANSINPDFPHEVYLMSPWEQIQVLPSMSGKFRQAATYKTEPYQGSTECAQRTWMDLTGLLEQA